jgi:predicted nucleotidyltransferase
MRKITIHEEADSEVYEAAFYYEERAARAAIFPRRAGMGGGPAPTAPGFLHFLFDKVLFSDYKMPMDLPLLKRHLLDYFRDENISLLLFGSRARGDHAPYSDIDIGIIPRQPLDPKKLTLLREWIENQNIPQKVELVDFSLVSAQFKEQALKDAEWWKE